MAHDRSPGTSREGFGPAPLRNPMETWRVLAGVSVMLVVWFGLMLVIGHQPGPADLLVAIVFAAIGIVLGERFSDRLAGRND